MNRTKIIKVAVLIAVTAASCVIAFCMNFRQLDVMFSSLFYIPMILAGIWFYRQIIPLTVLFVILFFAMDLLSDVPVPGVIYIMPEQLFRGLILIAGAVLFYLMGRRLELSRAQLAIEKERFRITLLSIGDGVISTDRTGRLVLMNDVARDLTGWHGDSAIGKPFGEVFQIVNEYSGEPCEDPVQRVLARGEVVSLENHTVLISKSGAETPVADSAAPIHDATGALQGVVLVFRDVTAEKEKQDKVEHESLHDQLTGLGNRRYLDLQITRLEKQGVLPVSTIVGDMNGLKLANDAIGHEMGDMLLKKAAETLRSVLRDDDIICRYGGDEFVVLLPGKGCAETAQIVDRLHEAFIKVAVGSVQLSISLGWAVKKDASENFMDVFRTAEDRMYARKLGESIDAKRNIITGMVEKSAPYRARTIDIFNRAAKAFNLEGREAADFQLACMVHDIGRVAIMEAGGDEPSPWDADEENTTAKRHAEVGYRILNTVPEYAMIARYVLMHHARWDGAGSHGGVKGEEIPYLSRIIAVADYYDSMTGADSAAPNAQEAADAVMRHAGTRFDPEVAKVFVDQVILAGENA